MATNRPSTASSFSAPVLRLRSRTLETDAGGWIVHVDDFGVPLEGDLRVRERLVLHDLRGRGACRGDGSTVTCEAKRVRNVASSIAESPPPTTAIGLPRKKKPSQVAHVDTPCPISARSEGRPSSFADAPVAMITVLRAKRLVSGRDFERRVWRDRRPSRCRWCMSAPNRSACSRIAAMRSGPMMPSGKPGKFSTAVVSIS